MNVGQAKRPPASILALSFSGDRVQAAVVRRNNGLLLAGKTVAFTLKVSLLTENPEQWARELRQHLEQAEIRDRRCAVCLPLQWALVQSITAGEMADADLDSLLEIEAERGFPYAPEAMALAHSHYRTAEQRHATLVAFPRAQLEQLEKALRLAGLRPTTFTLGLPALPIVSNPARASLMLALGNQLVDLHVLFEGNLAALRSLEVTTGNATGEHELDPALLLREIKITLGQLPPEVARNIGTIHLFGREEVSASSAEKITVGLTNLGLAPEWVKAYSPKQFDRPIEPSAPVSLPVTTAAREITQKKAAFEFLPPKVSVWQQVGRRLSSRKLAWAGLTALFLLVLIGGTFFYQHWRLTQLRKDWTRLEPQVLELQTMQQQIRQFRPWFDESLPALSILRQLTEAFPEDGAVSAKTLEISDLSKVTCSGVAGDSQAFLRMLDRLRADRTVAELAVDQMRGKTPLQFTFNFQRAGGQP